MLYYILLAFLALLAKLVYGAFFSGFTGAYRPGKAHGKKKKCIVIGGGVSGIACAKEMMDEGHEVEVYEKNRTYGGLWSFSASDRSSARVYDKLITNSSAMVMAFSDWPPQKERFGDEPVSLHILNPNNIYFLLYIFCFAEPSSKNNLFINYNFLSF